MIDGIREVLRLQAEAGVLLVKRATHARQRTVEMIATIELDAGFGGPDFHHAPGLRLLHTRGQREGLAAAVQHEVVVVALGEAHVIRDAVADASRLGEVKAGAFDGRKLAGRDERVVRGGVAIGVNHHQVVEDAARLAKVEVGVVGQVDDGGLVRRGGVINAQLVVVGERVNHRRRQLAGITFLAVRAHIGELDGDFLGGRREHTRFPDTFVEALEAAVEMVRPVVHRERVFLAVECELALGDAIRDAPRDGAEERMPLHIVVEVVEAKHDVAGLAGAVGHPEFGEDAAVFGDLGGHALAVAESVNLHFGTVGRLAENFVFELHGLDQGGISGFAATRTAVEEQRGGEGENAGCQREPVGGWECFHRSGAFGLLRRRITEASGQMQIVNETRRFTRRISTPWLRGRRGNRPCIGAPVSDPARAGSDDHWARVWEKPTTAARCPITLRSEISLPRLPCDVTCPLGCC